MNVFFIAIILCLSGAVAYLYNDVQDAKVETATAQAQLKVKEDLLLYKQQELQDCFDRRYADQQTMLSMVAESRDNKNKADNAIALLETAKNKKTAVLERPTLIQKMANNATSRVFLEVECVTGGKCDVKK